MTKRSGCYFTSQEKDKYIAAFVKEMHTLRAKANISQSDLANITGISRQTYGAIERGIQKMSWGTYLSMILFYDYNNDTRSYLRSLDAFPKSVINMINCIGENLDKEISNFIDSGQNDIFSVLDEQAIATIKTVIMVEYARCNTLSGEEIVKFFNDGTIGGFSVVNEDLKIKKALDNIKNRKC